VPRAVPPWAPPEQVQPRPAPARLQWLLDPGSLTQRLTRLAEGDFAVKVRHEHWQPLRVDECTALKIAPHQPGWVREVILSGQGQPWVFARSVAAQRTLDEIAVDLADIGNRSLGELLFCAPGFSRSALELGYYPPADLPPDLRQPALLARRSCFSRAGARVLVAEVSLPALWAKLDL